MGSIAAAGLTAGVAAATQPDPPDPIKFPKAKKGQDTISGFAQDRARQQAAAAFGRSDTIKTGARGLGGEPTTQRKTLLGT